MYNSRTIDLSNQKTSGLSEKAYNFLKEAKQSAAMEKVASFSGNLVQSPYPSPFLNLSDTHIPKSSNEIFEWCKYYYMFDPIISGAINALASFPVTEIFFEDKKNFEIENKQDIKQGEQGASKTDESDELKFYKKMLLQRVNIYKLIIEIGIDYYLYGNCFIFGEIWKSPKTGQVEWKAITRLDPSKIKIEHNPATQEIKYKWVVPNKIVDIINKRRPKEEYDKIPDEIKEAVRKHGAVILNPNNIYHFARPTDSMGENTMWGTPVIANVLKLLMYRNTLRQAQEAIAREHIVPFRVYYMNPTDNANMNANWSNAAQSLAGELMKTVRDPNYKVVSPVPVGLLNVGGDGKALMLTSEIEQVQAEILAGMNVPREFIFGGVSYSGSSVSLKILENQFITYRLLLEDFVQNFCIKKLAEARGEWTSDNDDDNLVTVKFNDLKMQDDVQQKQLILNLNQQGKVPDSYLFNVMGLDADKMKKQLEAEAKERLTQQFELQKIQAEQEFKMQKMQLVYQARLQKFQQNVAQGFGVPTEEEEQIQIQGENPQEAEQQQMQEGAEEQQPTEEDIQEAKRFIQNLNAFTPEQQQAILAKLSEEQKQLVNQIMQQQKQEEQPQPSGIDMRPMPEQKPPRRDSLK